MALALAVLPFIMPWLKQLQSDPRQLVVAFHLAFNLALAFTFILVTGRVAQLCERWLPAVRSADAAAQPRYLDPLALTTPPLALGNAAREAIRLADTVQDMLDRADDGTAHQRPAARRCLAPA